MIQLAFECAGLDRTEVDRRTRAIGETLSRIFERAESTGMPTAAAALEIAERRLAAARGQAA
jgi:hypothetical protein